MSDVLRGPVHTGEHPRKVTPIVTGTDVLRSVVRTRSRHGGYLQRLARDVGTATATLEAFAYGTANLSAAVLQKITLDVYAGRAEFDPTIDRLRSANKQEPISIGVIQPPFDPSRHPEIAHHVYRPPSSPPGIKMAESEKPKPPKPSPGWVT